MSKLITHSSSLSFTLSFSQFTPNNYTYSYRMSKSLLCVWWPWQLRWHSTSFFSTRSTLDDRIQAISLARIKKVKIQVVLALHHTVQYLHPYIIFLEFASPSLLHCSLLLVAHSHDLTESLNRVLTCGTKRPCTRWQWVSETRNPIDFYSIKVRVWVNF